jgi:ubiquinone/menaquinone biosynthesis C-methylase UbiE
MTREYFNQSANIWDETNAEMDGNKLKLMASRLDIMLNARVLDVGTGTGVLLPFICEKSRQVVALDFAEEMLHQARTKDFPGSVDYLHADVINLPIGDDIFDITICYSSFPHFQDKPKALAEIARVTRCGGRLMICHTSSRTRINQIHSQVSTLASDLIPDAVEMQKLLTAVGYIEISIEDDRESYLIRARKFG